MWREGWRCSAWQTPSLRASMSAIRLWIKQRDSYRTLNIVGLKWVTSALCEEYNWQNVLTKHFGQTSCSKCTIRKWFSQTSIIAKDEVQVIAANPAITGVKTSDSTKLEETKDVCLHRSFPLRKSLVVLAPPKKMSSTLCPPALYALPASTYLGQGRYTLIGHQSGHVPPFVAARIAVIPPGIRPSPLQPHSGCPGQDGPDGLPMLSPSSAPEDAIAVFDFDFFTNFVEGPLLVRADFPKIAFCRVVVTSELNCSRIMADILRFHAVESWNTHNSNRRDEQHFHLQWP